LLGGRRFASSGRARLPLLDRLAISCTSIARRVSVEPANQEMVRVMKAVDDATAKAGEPRVIKSLDEHPFVLGLKAEIERMKNEHVARIEDYSRAIRERDHKHAAEKLALQDQIFDLQNRLVELQSKMLAIRAAVS
jgi:hypothetical protein